MRKGDIVETANIMIVEDNTTVAEDAKECLESLGYSVTSIAATGEDAIENAGKDRPDAVLMDIKLRGEMDGIEAAERIHARFGIPVLFLSAFSDHDLLQRAKKVGSFGYLVKPFEERELHAMLEMTLYKATAEKERRRLEEKLAQMRKTAAIGKMAAGIAHHFNNMLQIILGNLELAKERLKPETEVFESVTEAETAARRASDMSSLMLTYLGLRLENAAPLDLATFCAGLRPSLRENMPPGVGLDMRPADSGPPARADREQMKQVLSALVANAGESMAEKPGTVVVSTGAANASDIRSDHRFPADWTPSDPAYAFIAVTDTGSGMTRETMTGIFDPFFTEKFTGRGLGLAAALGIVKAHGGCITVESEPEEGSVFRVFLPLSHSPSPAERRPAAEPPVFDQRRVLLVEDQESVRKTACAMLQRIGLTVTNAKNGEEAAAMFREAPDSFDLVISDLTMPGMNGWETLAAIRAVRPDIPCILASGYGEAQALDADHAGLRIQAFMHKPFQMRALEKTVAQALSR